MHRDCRASEEDSPGVIQRTTQFLCCSFGDVKNRFVGDLDYALITTDCALHAVAPLRQMVFITATTKHNQSRLDSENESSDNVVQDTGCESQVCIRDEGGTSQ